MPYSTNPKMSQWGIRYQGDVLAAHGEARRMLAVYMAQEAIELPEALAELIRAGYSVLVSTPPAQKSNVHGSSPMERRMGRVHLENRDNERGSGAEDGQVQR